MGGLAFTKGPSQASHSSLRDSGARRRHHLAQRIIKVSSLSTPQASFARDITPIPFSLPFAVTVTHLLPPYTATCFDTIMNRVSAAFLEPVPSYTKSAAEDTEAGEHKSHSRRSSLVPRRKSSAGSLGGSSLSLDRMTPERPSTPSSTTTSATQSQSQGQPKKGWLNGLLPPRKVSQTTDEPVDVPLQRAWAGDFSRVWRLEGHSPPPSLQPSMASTSTVCGIISCPDRPGEMPSMEWTKSMRINGLGKVDIGIYSAYVSDGPSPQKASRQQLELGKLRHDSLRADQGSTLSWDSPN